MKIVTKLISAALLSLVSCTAVAKCDLKNYYQDPLAGGNFQLKLDYPAQGQTTDRFETRTDFRQDWQGYLKEVLQYAWEGQIEVDFVAQKNQKRAWFHAPWLHVGNFGREKVHGLTKERVSRPFELENNVDGFFNNWGIGYFNAAAASQLGKIWTDFCNPSIGALESVQFPEGSVTFKMLFTDAPADKIKALSGAPTWQAHIHQKGFRPGDDPDHTIDGICDATEPCPRAIAAVSLLQVDVAIKDKRAGGTGWVFGTFVYDIDKIATADKWNRLTPISISWGNDPSVFPGGELLETKINKAFRGRHYGWDERPTLGWGGRANGPVDNPVSGCTACHGAAQFPASTQYGNWPKHDHEYSDQELLKFYFRNIKSGELFDPIVKPDSPFAKEAFKPVALDYSLQTQLGLERLCLAWANKDDVFAELSVDPTVCPPRSKGAEKALTADQSNIPALQKYLKAIAREQQTYRPVSK